MYCLRQVTLNIIKQHRMDLIISIVFHLIFHSTHNSLNAVHTQTEIGISVYFPPHENTYFVLFSARKTALIFERKFFCVCVCFSALDNFPLSLSRSLIFISVQFDVWKPGYEKNDLTYCERRMKSFVESS